MSLQELLPYLSVIASIIFGIVAITRNHSDDMKQAGKIDMEISTIASDVKDIKINLRDTTTQLYEQNKRIAIIERDVKTAFHRIDEAREDIKHLQEYHQKGVKNE